MSIVLNSRIIESCGSKKHLYDRVDVDRHKRETMIETITGELAERVHHEVFGVIKRMKIRKKIDQRLNITS
jgi:hypothetical protein